MTFEISRFHIEGLHGVRNIDITLKDNRLILVGENGAGKSTVVNLIFLFLTRQWPELTRYKFKRITAVLNNESFSLEFEQLEHIKDGKHWKRLGNFAYELYMGGEVVDGLETNPESHAWSDNLETVERSDEKSYQLPLGEAGSLGMRPERPPRIRSQLPESIQELDRSLRNLVREQVLFLPTYRRIEQDLKSIIKDPRTLRLLRDTLPIRSNSRHKPGFIEFVEFGMQDVEGLTERRLTQIKDTVRTELSTLIENYLRDVINGNFRPEGQISRDVTAKLADVPETTVDGILRRIPKAILTEAETNRLRDIISKTKQGIALEIEDSVVAHFMSKLIDLFGLISNIESDMQRFVTVCNQYLQRKELVYDNSTYTLVIHHKGANYEGSPPIKLNHLSSGEKQIVSLFSHLYLSEKSQFFVLIDEPELSLSVPWQQRFLPDILATAKCNGLIAVTHSPFIFDNNLQDYAHSLEEFVDSPI